ncbi:MAG TPA: Ig-like domain-containing protein, partial [Syntrophomonadaceae bacterium]|nr:Ig-like domain-containing protein [Syntrophomonadaceae bacterium]
MNKLRKGTLPLIILVILGLLVPSWSCYGSAVNPTVSTGSASCGETSATLNGTVELNGGAEITGYGIKWGTSSGSLTHKEYAGWENFKGSYYVEISGLQPGTTYYYQAFAQNSAGPGYGDVRSFTTDQPPAPTADKPSASTGSVGSYDQTSALLTGSVDDDGGAAITGYGFKWGTSSSSLAGKQYAGYDNHSGYFTLNISGLQPNTTYYYQAFAQNSEGPGYGDILQFTTKLLQPAADKPSASTGSVGSYDQTNALLTGSVDNDGGAAITGYGFKWGTSSSSLTGKQYAGFDNHTGYFNLNISGLQPNTTYYYQAFAQNSIAPGYGDILQFTTKPLQQIADKPSASTGSVGSYDQTNALLTGSVDDDGGAAITGYGFKWGTSSSSLAGKQYAGYDNHSGYFTLNISGLQPNTTYYYQAFAQNSAGPGYGDVRSFTTDQPPAPTADKPSASTGSVGGYDQTSALLTGSVDDDGGAAITGYGFKWGTSSYSLTGKQYAGFDNHSGYFTLNISGLQPNTTYYYQAFAQNSTAPGFGDILQFTTKPLQQIADKPSVSTGSVGSYDQTSALLTGSIDDDGGAAITGYGFKWGTSSSSLTGKQYAGFDNHSGYFTLNISGLQPNTTYYYQAFAQNSAAPGYGGIEHFRTLPKSGQLPTLQAAASPNGTVTAGQRITITASGTNCDVIVVRVDGREIDRENGQSISSAWDTSQAVPGNHIIRVNAYNQSLNKEAVNEISIYVTKVDDNKVPVVTVKKPLGNPSVKVGEKVQIEAAATDDVKVVAMGLYINNGTVKKERFDGNTLNYSWDTAGVAPGWYSIKITAWDGQKSDEDNIVKIKVGDVNKPEITDVIVSPDKGYAGQEFTFTAKVTNSPEYVYIQFDDLKNGMLDKNMCKNSFRFIDKGSNSDGTQTFTFKRAITAPGASPKDIRSFKIYAVNGSLESNAYSGTFVVHSNTNPGINIISPTEDKPYAKGDIEVKAEASWNSEAMNLYQVIEGKPDKPLIKEKVKGNQLNAKVHFDNSGYYTLKVTSVNIQNESTARTITILVGDPDPRITGGPTPSYLTYGAKETKRVELAGMGFIGYSASVDTVTLENTTDGTKKSGENIKIEAHRVSFTVPEELRSGKYKIYIKKSKYNQGDTVEGFEIKPIIVRVNGVVQNLSTDPILNEGTIMVPFEAFKGFKPELCAYDKIKHELVIRLTNGKELTINSSDSKMVSRLADGTEQQAKCNMMELSGTWFVPVRQVGEALGAQIYYDQDKHTLDITQQTSGKISLPAPPKVPTVEEVASLTENVGFKWSNIHFTDEEANEEFANAAAVWGVENKYLKLKLDCWSNVAFMATILELATDRLLIPDTKENEMATDVSEYYTKEWVKYLDQTAKLVAAQENNKSLERSHNCTFIKNGVSGQVLNNSVNS